MVNRIGADCAGRPAHGTCTVGHPRFLEPALAELTEALGFLQAALLSLPLLRGRDSQSGRRPAGGGGAALLLVRMTASLDVPSSAGRTRVRLGWPPREPGLLADLVTAGYFEP